MCTAPWAGFERRPGRKESDTAGERGPWTSVCWTVGGRPADLQGAAGPHTPPGVRTGNGTFWGGQTRVSHLGAEGQFAEVPAEDFCVFHDSIVL